jgi:hypothetical protein
MEDQTPLLIILLDLVLLLAAKSRWVQFLTLLIKFIKLLAKTKMIRTLTRRVRKIRKPFTEASDGGNSDVRIEWRYEEVATGWDYNAPSINMPDFATFAATLTAIDIADAGSISTGTTIVPLGPMAGVSITFGSVSNRDTFISVLEAGSYRLWDYKNGTINPYIFPGSNPIYRTNFRVKTKFCFNY